MHHDGQRCCPNGMHQNEMYQAAAALTNRYCCAENSQSKWLPAASLKLAPPSHTHTTLADSCIVSKQAHGFMHAPVYLTCSEGWCTAAPATLPWGVPHQQHGEDVPGVSGVQHRHVPAGTQQASNQSQSHHHTVKQGCCGSSSYHGRAARQRSMAGQQESPCACSQQSCAL